MNRILREIDDISIELVHTGTGWRVTATKGHDDIMDPFELSPYQPATAFSVAEKRIAEKLAADRAQAEHPSNVVDWAQRYAEKELLNAALVVRRMDRNSIPTIADARAAKWRGR